MIVIVFGLPGTGKTYFSERLAEQTGAVHLSTDIIREKLGQEEQYDKKTKQFVYDQLMKEMVHSHHEGKDVIMDGTFYKRSIRENVAQKAKGLKEPLKYIEIQANEAVITDRLKKDRDHSEADIKVYDKIKDEFEPLEASHLILRSTDDNIEEMINEAKEYIYER